MTDSQYWLLKVEPSDYPITKLKAEGKVKWDGVKNFQAQKYMKTMKIDDLALYYHTEKERAIVGIAKVVKEFYHTDDPKFGLVDVEYVETFEKPITLNVIKKTDELRTMSILRQPRLSVSSVTADEWDTIIKLSEQ